MWRALRAHTHTRSISWTAAAAGQELCVCVYISCSACVCVCVLRRRYQSCLCGLAKWQKNSPLTFPCLYWFTLSDLITSKSATVSAVHSPPQERHWDDTVCATLLDSVKIKSSFSSLGSDEWHGTAVNKALRRKLAGWTKWFTRGDEKDRAKRRQVSSSMQGLSVLITVSSVWRQTWVGFCWNLHEKSLGKKKKIHPDGSGFTVRHGKWQGTNTLLLCSSTLYSSIYFLSTFYLYFLHFTTSISTTNRLDTLFGSLF